MLKKILLKTKSCFYVNLLSLLNIFAFTFFIGCSNSTNNKDNAADSIARIKKINDSIAKEKKTKDSIQEIKRIQDSIAHEDSIKKAKQKKPKYNPKLTPKKYGVFPVKY